MGMGDEILADQLRLLPSTLPFSSGPEPCAACCVPVSAEPLVARSSVAFWAPRGELMVISHFPSTAIVIFLPVLRASKSAMDGGARGLPGNAVIARAT